MKVVEALLLSIVALAPVEIACSAEYVLQPGPGAGKDIWTTSHYSYAPGDSTPGGGLNDHSLVIGGWGDWYYSLLQFDLSGLPPVAQSARLDLYCYQQRGATTTSMYLERIVESWDWRTQGTGRDKERLWWQDKPAATPWSSAPLAAPTVGQWYSIELTDLYNAWQAGVYPNYGLQLRPVNSDNRWSEFYSSDFLDDPSLRPKLVVSPAVPPRVLQKPRAVLPGTDVTRSGTGFSPNGRVTLHFMELPGGAETTQSLNLDAAGAFSQVSSISFLANPGRYFWWAQDDASQQRSNEVAYEVYPRFGCVRNGTVTGRVVSECSDAPVQGATATMYDSLGQAVPEQEQITDADGRFTFRSVSCGTYEVRITKDGATIRDLWSTTGNYLYVDLGKLPMRSQDEAVLLVPGFLGSTLLNSASGPELTRSPGTPADKLKIFLPTLTGFERLRSKLCERGYRVIEVPWDWRMPPLEAAQEYLAGKINDAVGQSQFGKVHIVAHSMGGLLARSLIQERDDFHAKIGKLALVGVPNKGSVNPYYIWEGGDPLLLDSTIRTVNPRFPLVENFYTNSLERLWRTVNGWWPRWDPKDRSAVAKFARKEVPSARYLMSTEQFLAAGLTPRGTTGAGENVWLKQLNGEGMKSNRHRMSADGANGTIQTRLFIGKAADTLQEIMVGNASPSRDLYPDGEPLGPIFPCGQALQGSACDVPNYMVNTTSGDGTVPYDSAAFPALEQPAWAEKVETTSNDHATLVGAYADDIVEFIAGPGAAGSYAAEAAREMAAAPQTGSQLSISTNGPVRLLVTDELGRRSGMDPATGELVDEIPSASWEYDYLVGGVSQQNPAGGTSMVTVIGEGGDDFTVRIGYMNAAEVRTIEEHGFHRGQPITFSLILDSGTEPPVRIVPAVEKPGALSASPYGGAPERTRLTWPPSPTGGGAAYRIYWAGEGSDGLALLVESTGGTTTLDTEIPWAGDDTIPATVFVVAAVDAAGNESFFSDPDKNDDRDHDGLTDAQEGVLGTNPADPDTDNDGLGDREEAQRGTNALLPDTDGDGYLDSVEVHGGSDPSDSQSMPSPPQAADDLITTEEDTAASVAVLANDVSAPGTSLAVGGVVLHPHHGTAVITGMEIVYTPAADFFGQDSFSYTVTDGIVTSGAVTVSVTISPVNDPPSFTRGADQTVGSGAGPQAVAGWASGISAGSGESGQALTFAVTGNTNPGLFAAGPAIDAATGTLTYTPAPSATGTATVTVALRDDGGIADGGQDTSEPQSFQVTVMPLSVLRKTSIGPQDGWILEAAETSSTGGTMNVPATTIRIGDDEGDRQYRGILSFDTSALPNDAVISSATLRFKRRAITGTSPFGTHGLLTADIVKGAFSGKKSLMPADFKATATRTGTLTVPSRTALGWYAAPLGARALAAINTTGLTQFRLRFAKGDNDDGGADYLSIYSGNAPSALRPVLEIRYAAP